VKFLGVLFSAIAVGVTIVLLAKVYQFGRSRPVTRARSSRRRRPRS